ncbi:hypothetical protein I302_108937 [Kwoniella bestiolae CBS 10118]|uniref:DNA damage-binding protein 1 n=1 Tax=Kwoniella bestiolae CBS 10118 TaxID=1296100 RepID=A0A1B9FUI5_9TREE|nr:hypothetical protein I302_08078 [Kwoniella bestiolae CBS 10118]OCF22430.1 hypothetical protein I302_08078 [Kwoniella bestiolae CBS 10118]
MLYIASALTPTPILNTLKVPEFTGPNSTSLIVAKPDRIEVWDVEQKGLVYQTELEVWGNIVGIEKVEVEDARPHLLVLLAPPSAHLLLLTYSSSPSPSLIVTSSIQLTPPTPSLRQAEFFTSVIAHQNVALVSLWIGVLSCIEMEIEKDREAKKRRASTTIDVNMVDEGKRLIFKDNFNINIREHNLLHLSFLPVSPTSSGPIVSFLWLSATSDLQLQARTLSVASHSFNDLSKSVDVISPRSANLTLTEETDFNAIPFSCPAARRVLPIPSSSGTANEYSLLVIGDEHSVLYNLSLTQQSPKALRRLSAVSGTNTQTSPRGANVRRSPQTEMVSTTNKRRKSSMNSKGAGIIGDSSNDRWELKPVWRVRQGFGTVLAASVLEAHGTGASAIIGDECGRLTAIGWEFEKNQGILEGATGQNGTVKVRKVEMGTASPPSSLTYLDGSYLFLSSAAGDSSLVKLQLPSPDTAQPSNSPSGPRKGKGKARDEAEEGSWTVIVEYEGNEWRGDVDVKERWMNVAPVKDFCAVKEEGGGLSHLVISSGASNTNSLRIVRSGVGLEEVVNVGGIEGIEKIFTLTDSSGVSRLLLSTSSATLLLQVEPEISLIETAQQVSSPPTLAAGILPGADILVQVTPTSIALWSDVTSGLSAGSVDLDKESEIIAAQVHESLVVAAKRGGEVNLFEATPNGLDLVASFNVSSEISSVSLIQSPTLPSPVLAIGTWTNEILLYTLTQLQSGITTLTIMREAYFASSLHLKLSSARSTSTSTSGIQLLAGLSDGSLVIYDLEPSGDNGQVSVKSRKSSSLGNRPLTVCPTTGPVVGDDRVVAVGLSERMSVVFESGDRVDFSSVSRKDIISSTSVYSTTYGEVLVLASPTGISLTKINSLKKLSVQTLDLGDRSATKLIAYNEDLLVDGVVVRTMDSQNGEVLQISSMELRDSNTLTPLAEMPLKSREEITSLRAVLLNGKKYLCAGTAILPSDEEETNEYDDDSYINVKQGRLLLLDILQKDEHGQEWEFRVVVEKMVEGPVYDLEVLHGFLAVASGSKVTINRLSPNPPTLTEVSSFSSAFLASHLTVVPSDIDGEDRLVLGDGMRSIIVLSVDEGSGKVYDDTRDMATHQVSAMGRVRDGGEGVVVGDGYSNILTFRLKEGIEPAATFGLHEEIARFVPGSLAPPTSSSDVLVPNQLFATSTGRLGIIGELTPAATKTLDDLQRNMDKYWKGPGGVQWKDWRKGGNELVKRDTAGWIDGDFVQKYLNSNLFNHEESEKILRGSNPHEQVLKISGSGLKEDAERGDVVRILEAASGMH